MMKLVPRRTLLTAALAVAALAFAGAPVLAAGNVAEGFVQDNIQKGLNILNNRGASTDQRRSQFQTFLLSLCDMNRIADFTLGQYRRGASPAEVTAFDAAFQNYAVAVYQSYFDKYKGQSLKVTGSQALAADDFVVHTDFIDPNDHSGQPPLVVDFRVRPDVRPGNTGKLVVVDFAVSGIWLALEERDQFTSFLGQNGGNITTLNSHLNDLAKQYR